MADYDNGLFFAGYIGKDAPTWTDDVRRAKTYKRQGNANNRQIELINMGYPTQLEKI